MLEILVKGTEEYNEETNEITVSKDTVLKLEHSLISLARWESKWHKPFLEDMDKRTREEDLDYIRCMTISQNVDPGVYRRLSLQNMIEIRNYLDDTMTASWFNDKQTPKSKQKAVTAELIYYWMISLQIPFECEKWHLNRLLTLIRVCNIENSPKKKMRKGDIYKQNRALNEARRKSMGTRG